MTTEKCIPLHILEEITNGFSVDARIGRGGYGDVYKGVYNEREIAVKLLHVNIVQGLDEKLYINEVGNLLRVKHPNIVQLLGYSYEIKKKYVEHNGEKVFSEHIYRVLCFEYLKDGSLDKHLHAQSFAPNWCTRYNIIKGICEGLNFLHRCEPQIWHLDLKPANILLDSSMEPKLADFGLSRLFTRSHIHVTDNIVGTRKYMPPEFIQQGDMSSKNDVFSLGVVMIEIMTGRQTGYSNSSEMGDITQLMQKVLSNWKIRIKATSEYPSEESHQVQTCINTAMRCVELDRNKRPTIAEVLDILNMTESHIPKKQLADELPCQTVGSKNAIANMLRTTTPEVDNIRNKHQHFNSMPRDSFNIDVQQVHAHRETSSDLEHTLIIGRTEEKQKILSILSESITEEMVILPIYGIGGIGKTTLAQLVFNDTQFRGYSRVWVYVSQEFNLNTIGNSIISQLTNNTSNISNKQMLHKRLQDIFAGNSILIVLDDLWEEKQQELDKLKAMLRFGWGSKVIVVTTRDEAIARKICGTVIPYKLENLTDDMCWTIIQQKSDFKTRYDKDQLEQIGRDIAMKCGGVALAAQSLGYMLRGMTSDQWQSVRDSNIWNLSTSEDPSLRTNEVLASLLLSYSQMPECLQSCFSYCAVFPKGRKIVKCDLIHQWIALGFPEPSRIFDSMQLCEKYVTQLLGMSFLQYSKAPSSHGRWGEDITLFTMHDLVHDLATEMLADKVNKKGNVVGSSCHYAFLTNCSKPLQLRLSSPENTCFKIFFNPFQKRSTPENVKALFFLDCGEIELRGCAFSAAKFLLVLDLSECFIRKLPDSIGHLKKLRYLHAPRIGDRMIPSCITDLSELNYLNLGGSENISELPKSIGDMKGLMHLDLSGCTKICELPISFAELKQLVHLDLSHCNLSVAEALGGFTKLQYLNLSGCDGVYELPETFGDLKQLVHLDLSQCRMSMSEEFGGFTKLQYLNLSNKLYARADRGGVLEIIRNLTELRYLNLCRCMNRCRRMSQTKDSLLDSISTLSNLEHLDLSSNSELSSIPESFGNLRKLHTLDLSHCYFLKKLPNSMDQMVSLKILNVVRNFRLDETMLSRLKFASLPRFVVQASSDKFSSNISLLQHTNPDELTIYRLENVKSAAEARSVKLIEKQRIKELRLQWTVAAERFVDDMEVLEQLVPPSSINRLYISGYRSVSIPDWLMGIGHYLPNLRIIDLCDFPKCKNLRLCPLRNLAQLRLCRMESLEEWNTELMFPKLATLSIVQCAKLMTKPCLPRAMRLRISGSDNMISSWGESSSHSVASSSPITDLTVEDSKVPLHRWRLLHQLPALRNLTITNCSDLTTSPKIIKQLSSLESLSLLRLSECGRMTSLLQWLGELTSLMNLEITDCNGIRSLPDSIQRLTELKYLRIDGCFTLMKWCKSKENEMKLAHITNKFFR